MRRAAWPLSPRTGLTLVLAALTACAPWTRIPAPAPATLPPAVRLQSWLGGRAVELREVTVTEDSIVGRARTGPRPGTAPPRVALALAEIDSVRIRPPDRANWFGAGFGAGILAGIAVTATAIRLALGE